MGDGDIDEAAGLFHAQAAHGRVPALASERHGS